MDWSSIAMYENWNTSKLDATWTRSNSNLNNWKYSNSQTQDVVIGIETYGQKQFANTRTCNTPEMPDQVIFSLKDTSGNYVYDRYGDYWNGVNTQLGNGYLYFKNLPAGNYTVHQIGYGGTFKHSGTMNFKISSFAQKGSATLTNQ